MVDASKARSISSKKLLVTALFVATVYSRILYVLHTLGRFLHYNKTAGNKHDRFVVAVTWPPAGTVVGYVPKELSKY